MKTIFVVNYGTSPYFETNVGDKYYCKSLTSVKRKIVDLMKSDKYSKETIKKTVKPLEEYIFNKATCFSPGLVPNLRFEACDLYISIVEKDLF